MYGGLSKAEGSLASVFSQRWTWMVALVGAAGLFGVLFMMDSNQNSTEDNARAAGVSDCIKSGEDAKTCERRVETNHDDCFDWAHHPGGRYGGRPSTNQSTYNECIGMGAEAYSKMRQREVRERRAKKKKQREQYMP